MAKTVFNRENVDFTKQNMFFGEDCSLYVTLCFARQCAKPIYPIPKLRLAFVLISAALIGQD